MLEYDEKASKSALYAGVKRAPVNAIQREIALSALRDADVLTDRIMWVVKAIRRLAARVSTGLGQLTHSH